MRLEVMTFNIRYDHPGDGPDRWELRRDQVAELLARRGPDLAGLQEVLHPQLEWLLQALPEYAHVGIGRDDGRSAGEYAAILYRRERFQVTDQGTFWLSPTPEAPGSLGWGARLARICTWARCAEVASGSACYLFNTHLDHEAEAARQNGIALILERIAERSSPDPVILTGDFNAEERSPVLDAVRAPGSPVPFDAFRAVYPRVVAAGTFHGFRGIPKDRIDYIFLSPEWQVREAEYLRDSRNGRYPSDHFPVRVAVDWRLATDL